MTPHRATLTLSAVCDPTQIHALLHFDRTERLAPAEDAYTQALQRYKRLDDSHREAHTLRALGDLYVEGGEEARHHAAARQAAGVRVGGSGGPLQREARGAPEAAAASAAPGAA